MQNFVNVYQRAMWDLSLLHWVGTVAMLISPRVDPTSLIILPVRKGPLADDPPIKHVISHFASCSIPRELLEPVQL